MSVVFVSCARQNTLVTLKYHFHNDTEHIIEIKNYYGNGQIDYYKINPNEYLFLEKYTIFAESPKKGLILNCLNGMKMENIMFQQTHEV